jgi:EAL domain-containing protein (putative c-di-GMP-specific phosphodiesterase class I)
MERRWSDDASTIIVEGLIEIARRLGIGVIAEGIETEAQASQLWSMGCKLGQGFAIARAAGRDATAMLLQRHCKGIAGTIPLNAGREVTHPEPGRSEPAKRRAAMR